MVAQGGSGKNNSFNRAEAAPLELEAAGESTGGRYKAKSEISELSLRNVQKGLGKSVRVWVERVMIPYNFG